MDLRGVLGMYPGVRNGHSTIRANFEIDADTDDETVAKIVQTKTPITAPITAPITNTAEEIMGTHYTAVVVGAGQAGLAMSRSLTTCRSTTSCSSAAGSPSAGSPSGGIPSASSPPTG